MNNKIPKKHLRKYPLEITERGEPHYVYFIVTCPSDTREERVKQKKEFTIDFLPLIHTVQ